MSNNKTLADIAREMRTYFQSQKRNGNPEHRPWHQVLSDWADRIDEALAQNEAPQMVSKLDSAPCTGNASAMREALEVVREDLWSLMGSSSESLRSNIACEMSRKIRAALAAPPRNCDRFATVDEAKAEWLRTNAKLLSSTGLMPFESWLFAPAEGKEASNG